MKKHDKNKDGVLSKEELKNVKGLRGNPDPDGDGKTTPKELAAAFAGKK